MKKLVFLALILILIYTRFVNIGWGLPYPMHPDERNMAAAVQQLSCPPLASLITNHYPLATCLNPHFFAYGQFPLYIAYGGIQIYHSLFGLIGQPSYIEATIALRTLSAISSILLVFVLMKIAKLILAKLYVKKNISIIWILSFLFLIFQPYAIQLSHFGTTESILMFFYSFIIYLSLKLLTTNHYPLATIFFLALFSGLALGTKISSLLFLGIPILVLTNKYSMSAIGGTDGGAPQHARTPVLRGSTGGEEGRGRIYRGVTYLLLFSLITLVIFILSSPHNLLNWNDFISSITYESRVGLGRFVAFYTRQFVDTTPILFQFQKILPFSLGLPTLIGGILGFFLLPSKIAQFIYKYVRKVAVVGGLPTRADSRSAREHWRDGKQLAESSALLDILRFSLLLSLLPPSFFFIKWTRFISPSFPLFSLFALLFMIDLYSKWRKKIFHRYIFFILCLLLVIPGLAQLSIYTTPDVRFTASEWMYKNIPEGSKILTETANAIDLPIVSPDTNNKTPLKNFLINSFNFYDLDASFELQNNLNRALGEADYIIIPSRRIFYNHTCFNLIASQMSQTQTDRCKELEKTYPLLNSYYRDLFSGELGFKKIAEFTSFPKITFMGKTLLEFPDESAEETWTVFDHPVIRIYRRMTNDKLQMTNQITNNKLDFSQYKTINYQLPTTNHPPTSQARALRAGQPPITFYQLLVADTPEKWEKGLMYVKSKEDIGGLDGMIFSFPDSQIRTFWNKNTLSPLTLYWIQYDKVIGISYLPSITDMGVITTVSSPSSTDTVIEIIK